MNTKIKLLIFIISIAASLLSVSYKKNEPVAMGNLCAQTEYNQKGLCFDLLPAGGFPVTYLYSHGGVSTPNNLGFLEDDFRLWLFLVNTGIYYQLIAFVISLFIKIRK